jgi:[acyl-carrier-protein] S-malonyltransferase
MWDSVAAIPASSPPQAEIVFADAIVAAERRFRGEAELPGTATRTLFVFGWARSCRIPRFMTKRIAILFAGQGAQAVGMGRDLATAYPKAKELFDQADGILDRPLSVIAFEGPEAELVKTVNCQPALFVHGLACLAGLREELGEFSPQFAAGLSLGEFTAHAAAGTFSFADGLKLVAERGRLMQDACERSQGAMAAMIGGDEAAVRELAKECDVDVANFNSPGQIVLSGTIDGIDKAVAGAKEKGIRKAAKLNVAGAYHSRLMQTAADSLAPSLVETPMQTPQFPVIANVTARPVTDAAAVREALRAQVTGSVCWTETVEYLADVENVELFIELGPGGVVAGLVKRTRKEIPVISIADVASLSAAVTQLTA